MSKEELQRIEEGVTLVYSLVPQLPKEPARVAIEAAALTNPRLTEADRFDLHLFLHALFTTRKRPLN
jgi:hypothetical protein